MKRVACSQQTESAGDEMAVRSLGKTIDEIRRKDVDDAIATRDHMGRDAFNTEYHFGRATHYAFLDETGKRHEDPKAIIGVAYGYRWGEPLDRDQKFYSSERLVRAPLEKLGFTIIKIIDANDADTDDETTIGETSDDRALRSIRLRRGQKQFRDALIDAYEGRCAVSECLIRDLLEAAHIAPHAEHGTYKVTNGLLLRADLHTLLDCDLMAIDPDSRTVTIASEIRDSEYREFHGRELRRPKHPQQEPDKEALTERWRRLR
jgi:hypothetical protein